MLYNFIINPYTNKKVDILSKEGIALIDNYLKMIGGSEKKTNNMELTRSEEFYNNLFEQLHSHVKHELYKEVLPTLYTKIDKINLAGLFFLENITNFQVENYQVLHRSIMNSINYYQQSDSNKLLVYDKSFFKLKTIPNDMITIYAEMRDITINGDISDSNEVESIQNIFYKHMLSPADLVAQTIFYQALSEIAKLMFEMQKRSPEYLQFFREKIEYIGKTLVDTGETKLGNNLLYGVNIDLVKFNILANIYHYIPPLIDNCVVYRCETLWHGNLELLKNYSETKTGQIKYIFNGVTSTSADPRVGYSFNKLFHEEDSKKVIFKIIIPSGSKVIVPSVCYYDTNVNITESTIDAEFEILLFNRAIIRIDNIEINKTIRFYPSETLDDNEFNLSQPMEKTFGYFVTGYFLGYDQFD